MHVCLCVHVHGAPPHTHIHPQPNPPTHHSHKVGPQNQSKFNNTWTYQDNSILFEDLKSVENSPPIGVCIVSGWVGWWVGSGQITKNLNFDPIKIIQFCLKIYDL